MLPERGSNGTAGAIAYLTGRFGHGRPYLNGKLVMSYPYGVFMLGLCHRGTANNMASRSRFSWLPRGYRAESALASLRKSGPRSCSAANQRPQRIGVAAGL